MLTVQLINDTLGVLNLDEDPDGLPKIEQVLKRSAKDDGVIRNFSIDLQFVKKARRFIQQVFELKGIEGVITVNVYRYDPNAFRQTLYYTGKINLTKYEIDEIRLNANIDEIGFQTKFKNLSEVDVDMDAILSQGETAIPAATAQLMMFHSRKILKQFDASPSTNEEHLSEAVMGDDYPFCTAGCSRGFDQTAYGSINLGDIKKNELTQTFTYGWGFNLVGPEVTYVAREAGVIDEINISLKLKHTVTSTRSGGDIDFCGDSDIGNKEVKAWFVHKRANGDVVTEEMFGQWMTNVGCGGTGAVGSFEVKTYQDSDVVVEVGDLMYVYYTFRIFGNYNQEAAGSSGRIDFNFKVEPDKDVTWVRIGTITEYPATQVKTYMVYEFLNKICQYITDQIDCFRSEYFGRTDSYLEYDTDGPGSKLAVTNGRNLRAVTNKTIFGNWTDAYESINMLHCLGYGFEQIDGKNIVRVEPKEYFYNKNNLILDLGSRPSKLKKRVAMQYHHISVESSYPKLEKIDQSNAMDEFNTTRKFKTPITQGKNKMESKSIYRASGYEIEAQRRLTGQTKESKLDDANFMVSVVRDGLGFKPERNENFPFTFGIFDPDSAYNLDLLPTRAIYKWLKVIATNVIKTTSKILKFSSADGNYKVGTTKSGDSIYIAEDGNINMAGVEPLWYPEVYSFETKLTYDEMETITVNPYGYIRFLDWGGEQCEGYVLEVKHEPEQQKAEMELLRVYRP